MRDNELAGEIRSLREELFSRDTYDPLLVMKLTVKVRRGVNTHSLSRLITGDARFNLLAWDQVTEHIKDETPAMEEGDRRESRTVDYDALVCIEDTETHYVHSSLELLAYVWRHGTAVFEDLQYPPKDITPPAVIGLDPYIVRRLTEFRRFAWAVMQPDNQLVWMIAYRQHLTYEETQERLTYYLESIPKYHPTFGYGGRRVSMADMVSARANRTQFYTGQWVYKVLKDLGYDCGPE